ncbi:hypothetical protein JMJ77_0013795, partial [Colletotrichum scovillei]
MRHGNDNRDLSSLHFSCASSIMILEAPMFA